MNEFKRQLEVDGVRARGFGIIPKMPMLDRSLTIEAKAIYAYLASYAGNEGRAFPTTKKIQEDLKISKDRFYRHFKLLREAGYIEVEKNRSKEGQFKHNLYILVDCPKTEDFFIKPGPGPTYPASPEAEVKPSNISRSSNINKDLYNQSFLEEEELEKDFQDILEKGSINQDFYREKYKTIRRALELIYFRREPISLNGLVIPPEKLREDLSLLNHFHVDSGLESFREQSSRQKINNSLSYLGVCIYNSIFDMDLKLENNLRLEGII